MGSGVKPACGLDEVRHAVLWPLQLPCVPFAITVPLLTARQFFLSLTRSLVHCNALACQPQVYHDALEAALKAGGEVLQAGGRAIDAVVAAISCMEDNPIFNAGKGGTLDADGRVVLEASIATTEGSKSCGVVGLTTVKNPIKFARALAEHEQVSGRLYTRIHRHRHRHRHHHHHCETPIFGAL
jgi:hypothetical protein